MSNCIKCDVDNLEFHLIPDDVVSTRGMSDGHGRASEMFDTVGGRSPIENSSICTDPFDRHPVGPQNYCFVYYNYLNINGYHEIYICSFVK